MSVASDLLKLATSVKNGTISAAAFDKLAFLPDISASEEIDMLALSTGNIIAPARGGLSFVPLSYEFVLTEYVGVPAIIGAAGDIFNGAQSLVGTNGVTIIDDTAPVRAFSLGVDSGFSAFTPTPGAAQTFDVQTAGTGPSVWKIRIIAFGAYV